MAESAKFPKAEKLCGKSDIAALMAQGRRGGCACLRYCCRIRPEGDETSGIRVMVSVPKKHFKRAVKRNLLKRRLREAYRTQKGLLPAGVDVMLVYNTKEVLSFEEIHALVGQALVEIAGKIVTVPEER